jgi:hypothetical protein
MFSVMLVERRVVVGIVDKGTILVSIRGLHGCRKLSTILTPFARFAWPWLSAGSQPSGDQRINQE